MKREPLARQRGADDAGGTRQLGRIVDSAANEVFESGGVKITLIGGGIGVGIMALLARDTGAVVGPRS